MVIAKKFISMITNCQNIVITTHVNPDADGIGSQIALGMALRRLGKNVICVNEEPLLERYKYLDPDDIVVGLNEYNKNSADLFIVVDTNSLDRIGSNMKALIGNQNVLFIDHHPCPDETKNNHCIDTSMAATGELVGMIIEFLGVKFTKDLALPLYTSILIDTSSFRYPTVTANTHRVVAKLMDTGLEPPHAYNMIYGTKKVNHMQFLGHVLSTAKTTKNGDIAWITVKKEILERFNIDQEDTHALINNLLIMDGIKVAVMFRESPGEIKVSLRSDGDIDVGSLAKLLGGGGHDHSAATILNCPLEEAIKKTVKTLENNLT